MKVYTAKLGILIILASTAVRQPSLTVHQEASTKLPPATRMPSDTVGVKGLRTVEN